MYYLDAPHHLHFKRWWHGNSATSPSDNMQTISTVYMSHGSSSLSLTEDYFGHRLYDIVM